MGSGQAIGRAAARWLGTRRKLRRDRLGPRRVRRFIDVAAALVDDQRVDRGGADTQQLLHRFDAKVTAPKWVIEPRAFKAVDEHPDLSLFGLYPNQHNARSQQVLGIPPMPTSGAT